jgi:hypothetical protein
MNWYSDQYREEHHGCLRLCEPPPDAPDYEASQLELNP